MHFLPTDDQRDLQRGVRELLERRFPLDRLAAVARPDDAGTAGFDAGLWADLTETGVFVLRSDLGLGLADAALVFEELGRAAVPGPLVATFLAAGRFDEGPVTFVEPDRTPLLVAHLDAAVAVLVVTADEVRLATGVTGSAIADPLDPLTPLHELAAVPTGEMFASRADAQRLRLEAAVLTAALQVGLAARLTELAVDYAKTREQFGRTIGSFQAVKHLCADMFVRAELARVAVHAAAVTLDDPDADDAPRAVAGAKLLADEAATGNGRSSVQVHGGMGFTWEVPVHFLLKRAWVHATEFGTAEEHAEDLALLL
jgi:alkylation response protein AidB-like acyl-CoA dehydrogenase